MTLPALYELAREYREVADKLADMDLDAQTVEDTLESLSGDLEVKATNTAIVIRSLEAHAAAIKDAEAQMAARRKAVENRAARVKDYLLEQMLVAGIAKVESPYFRLSVRENPAAVEVYEAGLIPSEFMRAVAPPPPAPDKTAIREKLAAGVDVPGCRLTRGKRLEIK